MSELPDAVSATGGRLEREAHFHDIRFAEQTRVQADKFYEIAAASERHYRALLRRGISGQKVLEYGCGAGSAAYALADLGGEVWGVDISSVAIDLARHEALRRGVDDRCHFEVGNAEHLVYPDRHFDLVCGSGILHHLDLVRAYAEIKRVLRPGGRAVFYEPLGHNPLINWYRNRTPDLRTEDEHPLLKADLAEARTIFTDIDLRFFHLAALAAVPLRGRRAFERTLRTLDAVDALLLGRRSPLRYHAWMVVIELNA